MDLNCKGGGDMNKIAIVSISLLAVILTTIVFASGLVVGRLLSLYVLPETSVGEWIKNFVIHPTLM